MIEVVLSNGDSAEAETPDEAVYAARILMREAAAAGAASRLLTATFSVGGQNVREGVRYSEVSAS